MTDYFGPRERNGPARARTIRQSPSEGHRVRIELLKEICRRFFPDAALHRRAFVTAFCVALIIGCSGSESKPTPKAEFACASDKSCSVGRCDPFQGCVDCLFDHDCTGDNRCLNRTCRPVERCAEDGLCASGVCDPALGDCVECLADRDCKQSAHCRAGQCESFIPCTAESDCKSSHCDLQLGECVECAQNSDCRAHEVCSDNSCRARCESSGDCPSGQKCDTRGVCAQCLEHADCPGVYHCESEHCVLDVCEGPPFCSLALDAVVTCSQSGDALKSSACAAGEGCFADGDEASCHPRNCTPGTLACDRTLRYAELCGVDGINIESRVDCAAAGGVCNAGICVAQSCTPLSTRCGDEGVWRCNESGSSESLLQRCGAEEYCDSSSPACVPRTCAAGELKCDGEVVFSCNAAGSGWEREVDCVDGGGLCWNGACSPRACVAPHFCKDGSSFACVENSTRAQLAAACKLNDTLCEPSTGLCAPRACEPGAALCNGELVTTCNDEGSGPREDGIDCHANQMVCWAGHCLPALCDVPLKCAEGQLYRCDNHGTAWTLVSECAEGTVCDAAAGTCRLQKCEPGRPACDSDVATTCESTGLGYAGARVDCGQNQLVCEAGECAPRICESNQRYCVGDELRRCGASGATFEVMDTCFPSEYCEAMQGACSPDVCTAGAPICDGTRATQCAEDGSGPVAGGTDCSEMNRACERGICREIVCEPTRRFCADASAVSLCNALGTASAPSERCREGTHCAPHSAGASCATNTCNPGEPACDGERPAICDSSGSGYTNESVDCGATKLVCDLSGACVSTAADSLAANGTAVSSGPAYHFIMLRPSTSRLLSSFAVGLSLSSVSDLTWLLYYSDTPTGPYTLLRQSVSKETRTDPRSLYSAQGNVLGELRIGSYYLLGVGVAVPHSVFQDPGSSPRTLSFTQVLGSFSLPSSQFPEPTLPAPTSIQVGSSEIESHLWSAFTTRSL